MTGPLDRGVRAELERAAALLAGAGVPSPRHDAEELLAHAHGVERRDLWRLTAVGDAYGPLVERRRRREPLQHITGMAWFRHVGLAVGPGVFTPRPETELVAGAAVEEALRLAAPVVVDLCTGSGAIALSVATEVPAARVHAVELSEQAHAWAARNLAGSGVDLRLGDMDGAFPELDGAVDVVVTNPPYIPVGALVRDPEVVEHDPALALWSGDDGLDALRVVERTAARLLRPGGLLLSEHADLQGEAAPAVLTATGRWDDVADHDDLAGRPRWVSARRRP
ncbi:peptide chain release factor N(5)-glutamine methyltransferase [Vallicoccus soli]|uniref:Release factor glutamine methyltransferase n=1 Tax=Vallicoccus soli TaxID=2339232 RepID=A0A3A3ZN07_9ACTN|nr:peptide chain release factor N(5)-glutamine methyltransferase [Vallicoccus soli]RJK98145.1 peptide chain release factor N(5)-glutamine methyltransferase [Vallicoccus soli]